MLAGCTFALPANLVPPTSTRVPTRPPTETRPPSETPSITPTVATPTFTFTPTLLGGLQSTDEIGTPTGTPTRSPTAIQLVLGGPLTQTSYVKGFVSIILSEPEISWGDCDAPHEVMVTARVSEPARTLNVTIYVRLEGKAGGDSTDFISGTLMENLFNGSFTYLIRAEEIRSYSNFSDAWIQLQFVSTDTGNKVIDRTRVFTQNLSLTRCP